MSSRGWLATAAPLGFYVVLSCVLFGRDVLRAPHATVVGDPGADKSIFMWAFVWWPHAIAHGHDPFAANVVWVPGGIDLAWVTGVPGAALLALPLTVSVGPVVAYNVLALLAPGLAAWTAFLLCRWVTGSFWPSVLGGFFFGFSPYVVKQTDGHLHLTLVFLVPVCALLVLRRLAGELVRRRFVVFLGLALAGQFLFSTEVFLTLVLVGIAAAGVAWLRLDALERGSLLATVGDSVRGLLLAAVLVSPYLVHAFVISSPPLHSLTGNTGADLLNFVVPTHRTWLRPPGSEWIADHFSGSRVELTAYLGLPLVAILVLFAVETWRRKVRAHEVLLLVLLLTLVASLGSEIRILGHQVAYGPWLVFRKLPVSDSALPVRLSMYVALLAALVVAIWLTQGTGRRTWRWALTLLAVAFLFPDPTRHLWASEVPRPKFFASGDYKRYLAPGDVAVVLPYGGTGWSMLWQAEAGMRFRLVGAHFGPRNPPREAHWRPIYRALVGHPPPSDAPRVFCEFLRAHHVSAIVVARGTRHRARELAETVGHPEPVDDVLVYRTRDLRCR